MLVDRIAEAADRLAHRKRQTHVQDTQPLRDDAPAGRPQLDGDATSRKIGLDLRKPSVATIRPRRDEAGRRFPEVSNGAAGRREGEQRALALQADGAHVSILKDLESGVEQRESAGDMLLEQAVHFGGLFHLHHVAAPFNDLHGRAPRRVAGVLRGNDAILATPHDQYRLARLA